MPDRIVYQATLTRAYLDATAFIRTVAWANLSAEQEAELHTWDELEDVLGLSHKRFNQLRYAWMLHSQGTLDEMKDQRVHRLIVWSNGKVEGRKRRNP